jgi:hypothetical protein
MAENHSEERGEHKPRELRMITRLKALDAILDHRSTARMRRRDRHLAAIAELRRLMEVDEREGASDPPQTGEIVDLQKRRSRISSTG